MRALERVGFVALLFAEELAHLFGTDIAFGAQGLDVGQNLAAPFVQLQRQLPGGFGVVELAHRLGQRLAISRASSECPA